MIKKTFRLKKNKEFRRVYDRGRSFSGKYVVLYLVPNQREQIRFGFSVSSKVGKAVVRNRVKRILREICRKNVDALKPGYDLVLIARPRIKGIPYRIVEDCINKLWKKSKLWTPLPVGVKNRLDKGR